MKGKETKLSGCWVLEPRLFEDERGYFYEGFHTEKFKEITGIDFQVKQINHSYSHRGVFRGLHFQNSPKAQAKLVSCVEGEVLDVALDLRSKSSTYKHSFSLRLSEGNKKLLFIPKGFAHGFLVLSEKARLMYQVDELYSPTHESGVAYNDPELRIPLGSYQDKIVLSEKDAQLAPFASSKIHFEDV